MRLFLFWSNASMPLQHAEKSWDKEQRRNRREKQSTYDRPAKGSILFTTVPEPESHGHHADNHGQSGHQHWAEAREACFQCSAGGITTFYHFFRSNTHHQNTVVGCAAHALDGLHACGHA